MRQYLIALGALTASINALTVYADISVNLKSLTKTDENVGIVTLTDTKYGLLLKPNFSNLPSGLHGFHIHAKPSCDNAGMAAGGHYDPKKTNQHLGPYNNKGHLGDMPVLYVDANGNTTTPILAPRLSIKKITNRAIMIHSGGDNYTDKPPMGGGGSRIACGIIKNK